MSSSSKTAASASDLDTKMAFIQQRIAQILSEHKQLQTAKLECERRAAQSDASVEAEISHLKESIRAYTTLIQSTVDSILELQSSPSATSNP
jgi:hypothetical protein